ncbi:MAG TPA: alpha/beta fold hydrolase, partial [candidate division Zixibacteria bacterium]|nr:alpha/beta fold hydrolase [candidate division Zixibacteria bacterium]
MSTETTSIRKAHRLVHGEGATILCLHASTSSSKQWQPLAERMAARYRVVAADLYGYGQSPEWHGERPLTLDDEISLIADEIAAADEPVHLVGHSYGGAVAARVAVAYPDRVASLTLYEPVMFGLLRDDPNSRAAWEEIRAVERFVRTRTAAG